jgi:hypothetical protein
VKIWDTHKGSLVATLAAGANDQWLAITPAGFFAASRNATDVLSIIRKYEVTSVDQVHQSLFNPDLVREALAGDPDGEVARATEVINLEKVLDSGPAPVVEITSPVAGSKSVNDLVRVTARITDKGKRVGRINGGSMA